MKVSVGVPSLVTNHYKEIRLATNGSEAGIHQF